jgi:hypothetical protein
MDESKVFLLRRVLIVVVIVAILALLAFLVFGTSSRERPVTTFEECAAKEEAVIQNTDPQLCVYEGETFRNLNQTPNNTPLEEDTVLSERLSTTVPEDEVISPRLSNPIITIAEGYYETDDDKRYDFAEKSAPQFLLLKTRVYNPYDVRTKLTVGDLSFSYVNNRGQVVTLRNQHALYQSRRSVDVVEIQARRQASVDILVFTAAEGGRLPTGLNSIKMNTSWGNTTQFEIN